MDNDIKPDMGSLSKFILELEHKYGGWRPAARALGVEYQDLQYWARSGRKIQEFLDFLEHARKKEKLSKSAMWDKIMTIKK